LWPDLRQGDELTTKAKRRRIAVAVELQWPMRMHYELSAGVQDYAKAETDWVVEVSRYPELRIERGIRFDGVCGRISKDCLAAARDAGIPVVNTWINSPVADKTPNIFVDQREAGRIALEHLYARGLRRFAVFAPRNRIGARLFREGAMAAADEFGCPCRHYHISPVFEESSARMKKTEQSIERASKDWEAPIGLCVPSDDIARAIASTLLDLDWRIPDDAAMVTSGNNELICGQISPTLSSVDSGYYQNGFEAAALLDRLIGGERAPKAPIVVPPKELVVRRSSDVFAVKDPHVARALRFMAENSSQPLSVARIAASAGVCRQRLDVGFRREIGRTVNNELVRLRIEHLKRLLVDSDDTLAKVSSDAGFGTTVHMYRTFKRHVGMTPKQYRETHGQSLKF
jgi:LacI family transcriptional regulator